MENRKPQRRTVRKYEKSQDRNTGRSVPDGRPVRKYGRKREDDQDDRKNQGDDRKYQGSPERRFENNQKRYIDLGKKTGERNFSSSNSEDKDVRKNGKREADKDVRKYQGRSERSESNPEHKWDKKPTARPVRKYEKLQDTIRKPGIGQDSKGSKKQDNKKDISLIRLNRFIANSGLCSRRDADEHIKSGQITVNGRQVTDLGTKVSYNDDVRFKNKRLSSEKKVYILMNKPKDYVTTVEDPHAEHTVLDLLGDDFPERVYPVGRLDKATTGVLILTNDGELTGKLTHPKFKRKKIYHVFLDKPVTKNDLFKLTEGIDLEGTTVAADAVSYADEDDKSQIGIELHSGQNRVIRRMFETLGYKVKKLDRVYFAGLTKKNVQRGKWRFLTEKEVSMLKRGIF